MKTYSTISEAVKALKEATGHGYVRYFVDGSEVTVATWRGAQGEAVIYRNGMEIYAEKRPAECRAMKIIYTVNYTDNVESHPISPEFTTEAEARVFFEQEKSKLAGTTPADTTGWQDYDQAWSQVYTLELTKTTIDDDGDVEDIEALESTDYYYR